MNVQLEVNLNRREERKDTIDIQSSPIFSTSDDRIESCCCGRCFDEEKVRRWNRWWEKNFNIQRYRTVFAVVGRTISRGFSLFDLVTDCLLRFREDGDFWLAIILLLSVSAPFFVSYSSGVKLFMTRGTFENSEGFLVIFAVIYLLPTGIFYFVMLDFIEFLLSLIDMIGILQGEDIKTQKSRQKLWSKQLGMTRMDWEVNRKKVQPNKKKK
ncbi:hypothetical protein RFI_19409, partial [Reticulomyxa filosa]